MIKLKRTKNDLTISEFENRKEQPMDATKKFDKRAEAYTAGRPGYAKELIEKLYAGYGMSENSVVADIGSGTGKFAKQLLEKGSRVYCVEPNDDMRRTAEKELGGYANFHSVCGSAENTTLDADFADFITTAQAFHWFDTKKFRQECMRIIKPGGKVFLIWNTRDNSDLINRELYQIYSKFCPDFKGFSGGTQKDDPRIAEFFDGRYEYISFDNPLYFDREKFIARSLSGSYSLKSEDKEYAVYIEALNTVFDKYSVDGIVSIANQSVAYIGAVK